MPAILILTTTDAGLAAAWERQLPRPSMVLAQPDELAQELSRPGSRIWIADIDDPRSRLPAGSGTLVVLVGEPHSLAFEQARQNHSARLYLSHKESRIRLAEIVSLLEEIADKNAQLQVLLDRRHRLETQLLQHESVSAPEAAGAWNFLEHAIRHLGDRQRLLEEFRHAGRQLVQAGRTWFFLRQDSFFVADQGGPQCAGDDPLPRWLEDHPAAIDPARWPGTDDPAIEASVRQQLQAWGTHFLVPLHTDGRLAGWIAYGPRVDGTAYREADRSRAILLGRLLERCLERSAQLTQQQQQAQATALLTKYLPGARLISRHQLAGTALPVEVRTIADAALQSGKITTQPAQAPFRYRVTAGPVPEIDGVWVLWEDASPEIERIQTEMEKSRRELLRNIGLTLSHELSNPLVSLVTYAHLLQRGSSHSPFSSVTSASASTPPVESQTAADNVARVVNLPHLTARVTAASPVAVAPAQKSGSNQFAREVSLTGEIAKLQLVTEHASLLGQIAQASARPVDLGVLLNTLATARGFLTRIPDQPAVFTADAELLRFALNAIFEAISANRLEQGARNLTVSLQLRGRDAGRTAVISIEGSHLELDGILPLPAPGSTPNQGRLSVFLASEILRLHGGTLAACPGHKGTDIQISLRGLQV